MTFQFNFSQTDNTQFTVSPNRLEEARQAIQTLGFELMEIWHEDNVHSYEIWTHATSAQSIRLNISELDPSETSENDASRQEVVDELIDLWHMLSSIRDHLRPADDYEFDTEVSTQPITSWQRFWQNVEEFRSEKTAYPENWRFIFRPEVDEYVAAYQELSAADRAAITQ
jgi:sugar phosphate isomerase/epimerase